MHTDSRRVVHMCTIIVAHSDIFPRDNIRANLASYGLAHDDTHRVAERFTDAFAE